MIYQDFIDLGFKRINLDDQVAFKHTGYTSFCLEYKLNNGDYLSCAYPDFHVNLYDCEGDLIERNVDARMHIKKDSKPLTNYTYTP